MINLNNLLTILIVATTICAEKKSFEGYKLFKVTPSSTFAVEILNNVEKLGLGEFWEDTAFVNGTSKVMVSSEKETDFLAQMKDAHIDVAIVFDDLQAVINRQLKPAESTRSNENFHNMTWNRYHTLDEIHSWLNELENQYPDIVQTVTWGISNEGRPLKGIILNYSKQRDQNLVGVIEGTVHAREWISPATVTWIIKEFLSSSDPDVIKLAESFEWHFLPVANPDGYSYTFTDHRMWRKNRNTAYNTTCAGATDNDMSNGVDLNRNFEYQWMVAGASNDPCANTFAGPAPNSEPETRSTVNYMTSLQADGEIIYYIAFHSYSQYVIVPYSHVSLDNVLESPDYGNMYEISIRAAEKLEQRFGTHYRVGVSQATLNYPMSGASFDWVKSEIGVPVCLLLELRDRGNFGFLLPPEEIFPNNLEIMDFILELDKSTRRLGYYTYSSVSSLAYSLSIIVLGAIITFRL